MHRTEVSVSDSLLVIALPKLYCTKYDIKNTKYGSVYIVQNLHSHDMSKIKQIYFLKYIQHGESLPRLCSKIKIGCTPVQIKCKCMAKLNT